MVITIIAAVYLVGLMITGLCMYLALEAGALDDLSPSTQTGLLYVLLVGLVFWPVFWVSTAWLAATGKLDE